MYVSGDGLGLYDIPLDDRRRHDDAHPRLAVLGDRHRQPEYAHTYIHTYFFLFFFKCMYVCMFVGGAFAASRNPGHSILVSGESGSG